MPPCFSPPRLRRRCRRRRSASIAVKARLEPFQVGQPAHVGPSGSKEFSHRSAPVLSGIDLHHTLRVLRSTASAFRLVRPGRLRGQRARRCRGSRRGGGSSSATRRLAGGAGGGRRPSRSKGPVTATGSLAAVFFQQHKGNRFVEISDRAMVAHLHRLRQVLASAGLRRWTAGWQKSARCGRSPRHCP